ncbi:uncharacterized protein PHALS_07860 [Plasmopara halstedii]|uniref:Uncharacterized protein n=1 Tax=Plasmopara halstedii TaxID=4781 RepID=A0A0P1B6T9_PLAHL|nr:uncharacterized protein PHALS_07860 [Plasmopara halstedii]CEG50135.1 hypothetical protein PHALS_07860 [Plasmopara halstedii]|eukprot:XP_024586504.1 hypothetical protein PHALS_07860 [Plasmopara halstedii]
MRVSVLPFLFSGFRPVGIIPYGQLQELEYFLWISVRNYITIDLAEIVLGDPKRDRRLISKDCDKRLKILSLN